MTLSAATKPVKAAKKQARPPKLTDAQLAAQAVTRILGAHSQPRYDLATEPWIPVLRDGEVVTIGLRELLTEAHQISDLALPNALLRASMRRLLGALTADLIRRHPGLSLDDWRAAHSTNCGFTPAQVDLLLNAHGRHLWLWHPASPFLQDPRLARGLVKPHVNQPAQELLLHLPSGSSAAWWVKAGEPALLGGLRPDQSALWLTVRWFYGVNGNCGDVRIPDGATVGSHAGGAFAETVATVTHAFRVDSVSLFRSLLRGLGQALPQSDRVHGDLSTCAWLDPDQPRPVDDPLYLATVNVSAVLLAEADEDGNTTRFVRGSTPVAGEQAKLIRDLAMRADTHRVTVPNEKGHPAAVRVLPSALRGDVLQAFHRAGFEGLQLAGVINSAQCWLPVGGIVAGGERLELLLVGKAGTGSSPVWDELSGMQLPARHLDPAHPDPEVVRHVRAAVQIAFDPKDGVRQRLEWAVADLLAQPGPDGWKRPKRDNTTAQALTNKAVNAWLSRTAAAFDRVLDSDSEDEVEAWRTAVWSAARAAFDEIATPYITSTRYAPRYAVALRQLTSRR